MNNFEHRHPYLSGFIGGLALVAFYSVTMWAGAYYGY